MPHTGPEPTALQTLGDSVRQDLERNEGLQRATFVEAATGAVAEAGAAMLTQSGHRQQLYGEALTLIRGREEALEERRREHERERAKAIATRPELQELVRAHNLEMARLAEEEGKRRAAPAEMHAADRSAAAVRGGQVRLRLMGQPREYARDTFSAIPGTPLAEAFSGKFAVENREGVVVLYRDPETFRHMMAALKAHAETGTELADYVKALGCDAYTKDQVTRELEYWAIPPRKAAAHKAAHAAATGK